MSRAPSCRGGRASKAGLDVQIAVVVDLRVEARWNDRRAAGIFDDCRPDYPGSRAELRPVVDGGLHQALLVVVDLAPARKSPALRAAAGRESRRPGLVDRREGGQVVAHELDGT